MDAELQSLEVETISCGDHDLTIEDATFRQLSSQCLEKLREVAIERFAITALQKKFVAVAEHEYAEAIPLGFKDPGCARGYVGDSFGKHG